MERSPKLFSGFNPLEGDIVPAFAEHADHHLRVKLRIFHDQSTQRDFDGTGVRSSILTLYNFTAHHNDRS
jgi:hypothetical protein